MSDDQSSEARSSSHREQQDLPVATVTVTLTKFGADAPVEHATRLIIHESHLETIQRKHGLSLIKWLETALEIELEALTDDTTWEIQP